MPPTAHNDQTVMNLEKSSCAAALIASRGDRQASEARIAQAIARAAEREPQLKAFCFRPDRYAPIDAATAASPLAGLPIAVKDLIATADMPTTYGSPIYEGFMPKKMRKSWRSCARTAARCSAKPSPRNSRGVGRAQR